MLAVLPLVALTQIGVTVALGVLLDTFVVRTLLVPALTFDWTSGSGGPRRWHAGDGSTPGRGSGRRERRLPGVTGRRPPSPGRKLLRIGDLSRRVGVPVESLRARERRYGLLGGRTPGGFRLYGENDVARAVAMRNHLTTGCRQRRRRGWHSRSSA